MIHDKFFTITRCAPLRPRSFRYIYATCYYSHSHRKKNGRRHERHTEKSGGNREEACNNNYHLHIHIDHIHLSLWVWVRIRWKKCFDFLFHKKQEPKKNPTSPIRKNHRETFTNPDLLYIYFSQLFLFFNSLLIPAAVIYKAIVSYIYSECVRLCILANKSVYKTCMYTRKSWLLFIVTLSWNTLPPTALTHGEKNEWNATSIAKCCYRRHMALIQWPI